MAGISPADCVAPAFNLMQKRLFQPFRFGYWSRIAVLGVLTGELSTSGNGGGGSAQHRRLRESRSLGTDSIQPGSLSTGI